MSQLRRMLPSLNSLVAFEAVMRCGTFASAAKELGVTSPAVSRTIGRLEGHLGLPLFDRTPTGAVPTPDGTELFSGISRSFGEIEGTLVKMKQRSRPRARPIVMSVSSAFATHWFMPRLARFQAAFPSESIKFQLISGPLGGPAGDADIAMRFDHRPEAQDQVVRLMPELVLPVAAARRAIAPRAHQSAEMRQLLTLEGSYPDWSSVSASAGADAAAKELPFSDYSLVIQAALVGQGIALGWLNVVADLLVRGDLVPAGGGVIATGRQCDLVMRRHTSPAATQDICEWIVAELRDDLSKLAQTYPDLALDLH
jgi:LysR family transcriptional regulator, glycine cleavage system transcriptional activator